MNAWMPHQQALPSPPQTLLAFPHHHSILLRQGLTRAIGLAMSCTPNKANRETAVMEIAGTEPHFRFLDLPGEIRNQIYKELLCAFNYEHYPNGYSELARILGQEPKLNGVNQIDHSVNANILRASHAVHREAYDIMVKTNRFIRIQSWNYSLSNFLIWSQLPVVTMDRQHTAQFKGYVLQVRMETASHHDDVAGPLFDCESADSR
jgi:hypothetical protein